MTAPNWQSELRTWAIPNLVRISSKEDLDESDAFILAMSVALGIEAVFARHNGERASRKLELAGLSAQGIFELLAVFRAASNYEILLNRATDMVD